MDTPAPDSADPTPARPRSRAAPDGDLTRHAAESALLSALEEWATSLGDAGVRREDGARYFPSRPIRSMREAHGEGRLVESLTEWLPRWRGLRTSISGSAYANRMRDIVEHDCPLWEEIVAARDQPWAPYVTDEQRDVLERIRAAVDDEIARGARLRAAMLAERNQSGRAGDA